MESAALVAVFIDGESYAAVDSAELSQNECCERFMYLYSIDILGYSFHSYGVVSHSYFVVVIMDSVFFFGF